MEFPPEIDALLARVSSEERRVLLSRFGLDRGQPRTLLETAVELGLQLKDVRRIEESAMATLRKLH